MLQFVLHMTDQSHTHYFHQPRPLVASPHLHPVKNSEVVTALMTFIKERNWTVMYAPLFDAGILERNEGVWSFCYISLLLPRPLCCAPALTSCAWCPGSESLLDLFWHMAFNITWERKEHWWRVIQLRQKRGAIRKTAQGKQRRQTYKCPAKAETCTSPQLHQHATLPCL